MPFFPDVPTIKYEGPDSRNPLAFRHYNPDEVVEGKTMRDQLRFAVCYWHTFRGTGSDPFGAIRFNPPPLTRTTKIAVALQWPEPRQPRNAIRRPFGDHAGFSACTRPVGILLGREPLALITYRARRPFVWRSKAILPSYTRPSSPSAQETVTTCPLTSVRVAAPVPTTQGMPSSRETLLRDRSGRLRRRLPRRPV